MCHRKLIELLWRSSEKCFIDSFINVLNSHDGTGSHFISLQRGSLFHEALISLPIIQHETDIGSMQLSMTDDHVSQHPGLERRKKETPMNVEW